MNFKISFLLPSSVCSLSKFVVFLKKKLFFDIGECSNNSSFMTTECRKSCKTCPLLPGFYRKGEWKHYEDIIELYIADDSPPKLECEDQRKECSKWQRDGDCEQYPEFMESKCPKSCNTCKGLDYYRKGGDLGVLQSIIVDDDMKPQDIQWMIGKARNYIEYIDDPDVIHSCKNKHRFCAYWAAGGECALNKSCKWARNPCMNPHMR
jgi:hypothetical protein